MFYSKCGAIYLQKAGAGARFISYIIDQIILYVIWRFCLSVVFFKQPFAFFIIVIVQAIYLIYFFAHGQTPGMMVMKIKLCRTDGTYPIGYMQGLLRWIGMYISGLVFHLGFIWILIDKNKQGWHDKIADTYVVKINE
ncbi:MAG: RDD family protein [Candidatus Argoarchaeum ethanivorans]|uniref:RDD family protein n=1 Tax=Candidatus Argoarchaeum ethanivorans TaxID=2608793 RepID=A0A811T6D0_9EURY|nr:MAG: RDD family protein [Candidatus Argoarchaeum ethanivorans]